jgi:ribonuclease HII
MPSPKSSTQQLSLEALPPARKVRKVAAKAVKKKRSASAMAQVPLVWSESGLVAGVDEAGRGPLAGSVVAAAVILDDLHPIAGLADSKKLTALKRAKLYDEIRAKALCVGVGEASVDEIDRLNILQATMLAMQRAVANLRLKPSMVLVDGNRIPKLDMLAKAIVQGDAKVQAISAASIIAKVTRDRQCEALHAAYPQYGFDGHKGYGTAVHMAALKTHGATPAHRKSFAPVRMAMQTATEIAA